MPVTTTVPSAAELLERLSRSSEPRRPPRTARRGRRVVVRLPRPPLLIQLLVWTTLGMLVLVCAGIVLVGLTGLDLVRSVREHQAARHALPVIPLPEPAVLLDPERLGRALARHPGEAGRFLAARARAVGEAEGPEAALAVWAEAEQAGGVAPGDRVEIAALLVGLRRAAAARSQLDRLPWEALDEAGRARATDLLGRCFLLDR